MNRINLHAEKAASKFDAWASTYDEHRLTTWFRFYQLFALSKLNISEGSGFLDVGCGTGWAVREAAKQLTRGKACGIDISPKMIDKAKNQTPIMANIEFRVANSEIIPYPDESISSVLCTFSFHHYQNPLAALLEIRRVMRKTGKLVILDSARDVSPSIWLQDRLRRYFEPSHVKYYTTNELKILVEQADLRIIGNVTILKRFNFCRKLITGLMLIECKK